MVSASDNNTRYSFVEISPHSHRPFPSLHCSWHFSFPLSLALSLMSLKILISINALNAGVDVIICI